MKNLFAIAVLTITASVCSAQVRMIDAPYPTTLANVQQGGGTAFAANNVPTVAPDVRQGFEVTPADVNIRRTLIRWSKLVGWTFDAEHWVLDRDIPVSGSAALGSDFKTAVRTMMASTEFTDLPAQPCFYSNNVLRIIPLNELCSRQQATKFQ